MNALKGATGKMDHESEEPTQQSPVPRMREGEVASLTPREASLPEGIQAVNVTHYQVGKYSYTSLDDAMAEHRRQSNGDDASQDTAQEKPSPI